MTQEQYQEAADYWKKKDAEAVKMDKDLLLKKIEMYMEAHNTCALATGCGDFIRCTPIEYSYHDGSLWMFSEGGQKFIGLSRNKNVSIAIFDAYNGFGQLNGMQISGTAEIVEPFSDEYNAHAKRKGINPEALKKLPFTMNLIKIKPTHIDYLCSDLKKDGYDSRQALDLQA